MNGGGEMGFIWDDGGQTARRHSPTTLLDTDLYKLTMQQAVLELYPDAVAEYEFINRRPEEPFRDGFGMELQHQVERLAKVRLEDHEAKFLREKTPFLKPWYIEYLRNYRFDPDELVQCTTVDDNQLKIRIKAPWHRSILWEVPLMSTVSALHFAPSHAAGDWGYTGQAEKIAHKCGVLKGGGCLFADFGTRRRRGYTAQDMVVSGFKNSGYKGFVGTSNVHLAQKYNTTPIGTMAHEWIQAHAVLSGLRHANRYALEAWSRVYGGRLGIALTDTFGTPAFFADFDHELAHLYDGVRHDSGCPFDFAEAVVGHYKHLRINPDTKVIVFSDSLNVDLAVKIQKRCNELGIKCSFGIGTHFTNDFDSGLRPLNIVIKLVRLNGVPVVKLSDDRGKEIGDRDALRVARWTFLGTGLDD